MDLTSCLSLECGEMLCRRTFPTKWKEDVYKTYLRPTILYGGEAWCLRESQMGIFQRTDIQDESNEWGTEIELMMRWSEAMCLTEMGTLSRTEIHCESNVWSTAQRLKISQRLYVDVGYE